MLEEEALGTYKRRLGILVEETQELGIGVSWREWTKEIWENE
jgi:hypothetical protein